MIVTVWIDLTFEAVWQCNDERSYYLIFTGLGAGLAVGAVAEAAKRSFGFANLQENSKW